MFEPLSNVLRDSDLSVEEIEQVILYGNLLELPGVIDQCKSFFDEKTDFQVLPEDAVATGASMMASNLVATPH